MAAVPVAQVTTHPPFAAGFAAKYARLRRLVRVDGVEARAAAAAVGLDEIIAKIVLRIPDEVWGADLRPAAAPVARSLRGTVRLWHPRRRPVPVPVPGRATAPPGHRGPLLRAWRERLGLTQPAIGQRAGLAARTVSWIEHHGRGPSLERLERALEMVEWERCRQ